MADRSLATGLRAAALILIFAIIRMMEKIPRQHKRMVNEPDSPQGRHRGGTGR